MRTLLKIIGSLLVLALFALGCIVALGLYLNERAEKSAHDFCATAPTGTPFADLAARATSEGIPTRQPRKVGSIETTAFVFQGWVFNAWTCEVDAAGGRVTATRVIEEGD